MPYNPGITDISGQLLGRGMESAAQARAQGINAIGNAAGGVMDFFAKRQEENKDLQAKNKAIENIISTHPEIFAPKGADGSPDAEKLSMFLQTDPNENLKQKYARISSFMEGTITSKKMEQMQQQTADLKAQTDQRQAELSDTARATEMMKQFGFQSPSNGQPQATVNPMADPFIKQAIANTGLIPTTKNMGRLMQEAGVLRKSAETQAREERSAGVMYKDEESAQAKVDEFNADPKNMGIVAMVQPDAVRGGFVIKKQPTSLKTPTQEAAATAAVEEAKITTKRAGDLNDQIAKEALDAVQDRPRLQRIRDLYNAGIQTGFGQDWVTAAQSAAAGLGYGDKGKTAQKEELRSLLDQDALAKAQKYLKGGGSISNQERNQLSAISQSFGKVEGSNLALINMTEAAYNKSEAAERIRSTLEDQGQTEREIASSLRKWIRDPNNSLDRFAPKTNLPPKGTRVIQNGVTYESDGFGMTVVK